MIITCFSLIMLMGSHCKRGEACNCRWGCGWIIQSGLSRQVSGSVFMGWPSALLWSSLLLSLELRSREGGGKKWGLWTCASSFRGRVLQGNGRVLNGGVETGGRGLAGWEIAASGCSADNSCFSFMWAVGGIFLRKPLHHLLSTLEQRRWTRKKEKTKNMRGVY